LETESIPSVEQSDSQDQVGVVCQERARLVNVLSSIRSIYQLVEMPDKFAGRLGDTISILEMSGRGGSL
jgi:hypothetical protein